jgi:transcription antitermination factor NusG
MDGDARCVNRLPLIYRFWPGDRVRIEHGDLAGLSAVVSRIISDRKRLLAIEDDGSGASMSVILAVSPDALELLER